MKPLPLIAALTCLVTLQTPSVAAVYSVRTRTCAFGVCRIGNGVATSFRVNDNKTYLLTAAHVVDRVDSVWVGWDDSEWTPAVVMCRLTERDADAAILIVSKPSKLTVHKISSDATGPLKVNSFKKRKYDRHPIQIGTVRFESPYLSSITYRPAGGESGCPLLNSRDEIVGVVNGYLTRSNVGYVTNAAGIAATLRACKINWPIASTTNPNPNPAPQHDSRNLLRQLQAEVDRLNATQASLKASQVALLAEIERMKSNWVSVRLRNATTGETSTQTYKFGEPIKFKKSVAKPPLLKGKSSYGR